MGLKRIRCDLVTEQQHTINEIPENKSKKKKIPFEIVSEKDKRVREKALQMRLKTFMLRTIKY